MTKNCSLLRRLTLCFSRLLPSDSEAVGTDILNSNRTPPVIYLQQVTPGKPVDKRYIRCSAFQKILSCFNCVQYSNSSSLSDAKIGSSADANTSKTATVTPSSDDTKSDKAEKRYVVICFCFWNYEQLTLRQTTSLVVLCRYSVSSVSQSSSASSSSASAQIGAQPLTVDRKNNGETLDGKSNSTPQVCKRIVIFVLPLHRILCVCVCVAIHNDCSVKGERANRRSNETDQRTV